MLIIGIILAGLIAGFIAQLILGRTPSRFDWGMALGTGLAGSFVGGLLASLIAGDGLDLRASGLIGSVVGAVILTVLWQRLDKDKKRQADLAKR